jgi:hypothetical protein
MFRLTVSDAIVTLCVNLAVQPSFSLLLVKHRHLRDQRSEARKHTIHSLPLATLVDQSDTNVGIVDMIVDTLHHKAAKVGAAVAQQAADTIQIGPSTILLIQEVAASVTEEVKVDKDRSLDVYMSDVTDAKNQVVCFGCTGRDAHLGHVVRVDDAVELSKHTGRIEGARARTLVITRL